MKETERLTRLINQVLDLAKIESGRAEWHETRVDMRELISDTVTAMEQVFQEKGIRVSTRMPDRVSPVRADLDRMIQVMLNLLQRGEVLRPGRRPHRGDAFGGRRLAARRRARQRPGVRPQDRDVIFDKFRQAGDTLTEKPHGTGLGLPISRHIVERHGGQIWVENHPGPGACFAYASGHEARGGRLMAKRVLIADDEENIVTALEFLLQRRGYETRVAKNGDEALSETERAAPDLVLLDVMMPRKSGYEVCQRARPAGMAAHQDHHALG